jgi:hypothetical protein
VSSEDALVAAVEVQKVQVARLLAEAAQPPEVVALPQVVAAEALVAQRL